MSRRSLIALAILPLFLGLAACGPGTPAPRPSAESSVAPSPSPSSAALSPSATPETPAAPTAAPTPGVPIVSTVAVNSGLVSVYDVAGERLASVSYDETDHVAAAARIAAALGRDPVITTTVGDDGGCSADQTIYDFGGFILRSPGFAGSIGSIEAQVTAAETVGGVPIVTIGGGQVGMTRAAFEAAVGIVADLGSSGSSAWLGFNQSNPGAAEYDAIGSIARVEGGVVAQFNAPYYFYGDC